MRTGSSPSSVRESSMRRVLSKCSHLDRACSTTQWLSASGYLDTTFGNNHRIGLQPHNGRCAGRALCKDKGCREGIDRNMKCGDPLSSAWQK
jgi:hypothetical protein